VLILEIIVRVDAIFSPFPVVTQSASSTGAVVQLLVTFTFQCATRAQVHRAAVTQDSELHTRHAVSQ